MNKKKIFFATPISAFKNNQEYIDYRNTLSELIIDLKKEYEVYSEVELISNTQDFDTPYDSAKKDLNIISESDLFIIHHPKRLQTSTLIELGYAFALNKKIILISEKKDLPYLGVGLINFNNVYCIPCNKINKKTILDLIDLIGQMW